MGQHMMLEAGQGVTAFDVRAGLYHCVGNQENYKKALFAALKSIRGKLPILTGMVEWKEYDGFCPIANMLSKICYNIGADNIAKHTEVLERAVLNGEYSLLETELPDFVAEVEQLLTSLEEVLRRYDHLERESLKNGTDPEEVKEQDEDVFQKASKSWLRKDYQPVREVI